MRHTRLEAIFSVFIYIVPYNLTQDNDVQTDGFS